MEVLQSKSGKGEPKMLKEVRQGCSVSFYLFNVFIEEAIIMLKEETKQIKINEKTIHWYQVCNLC